MCKNRTQQYTTWGLVRVTHPYPQTIFLSSRETSDYIQLEVPADEDFLEFPPNSPAATTKLAFKDKINFIIPKLKKKSGYTGKSCIKHHSILCKVCPLLKRARIHRFRLLHKRLQTASTASLTSTSSSDNCVHDHNSIRDPKISGNDPKNSIGNPFLPHSTPTTKTASLDTLNTTSHSNINNTVSDQLASGSHNHSINNRLGSATCTSCVTCCCPRGSYSYKHIQLEKLGSKWIQAPSTEAQPHFVFPGPFKVFLTFLL